MNKTTRKKSGLTRSKPSSEIGSASFRIAVYGLGHVGAPIASTWLRAGAYVIGVDKSQYVLEKARKALTHIPEPGVSEAYAQGLEEGRFQIYDDPIKASHDSVMKMICVPVLALNGSADLTALKEVAYSIAKGLKRGDIVTVNPSVPPGTTEDIVIPILEGGNSAALCVERDFYVIYNPERIYEGRAIEDIEERYLGIIAGAGPKSLQIAAKIFPRIFKKGIMKMNNIRTAETEKLLEGVYRDVNIALANEMAKLCDKIDVDFWEAREAANSQPFCHIHKAGAGVGGACIPVYPQFIAHTARIANIECNIVNLGRSVNDSMPQYCVSEALKLLQFSDNKPLQHEKLVVTLLGLAFRGNVSDTRLSPTYKFIEELERLNVKEIRVHDPFVKSDSVLQSKAKVRLTTRLNEAISQANLILLVTDHGQYSRLASKDLGNVPVYDARGILERSMFNPTMFHTIGRGNNKH